MQWLSPTASEQSVELVELGGQCKEVAWNGALPSASVTSDVKCLHCFLIRNTVYVPYESSEIAATSGVGRKGFDEVHSSCSCCTAFIVVGALVLVDDVPFGSPPLTMFSVENNEV